MTDTPKKQRKPKPPIIVSEPEPQEPLQRPSNAPVSSVSVMERKAQAYRNLFNKGEDAQIVLLDLMEKAGITSFRGFNGPGAEEERLRHEGIRQLVFGILAKLPLTDEDIKQHIMNRLQIKKR